jgi:hypothetical protein
MFTVKTNIQRMGCISAVIGKKKPKVAIAYTSDNIDNIVFYL